MQSQTGSGIKSKQSMYSAYQVQGKLYLQINDVNTYKGIVESSPYYDLSELKDIFLKGELQTTIKTSSKLTLKYGFLKIQLQSQSNYQIQQLKKQIQECENKIKGLQNLKGWEVEDLNSTAPFDLDCIYRISTTSGWSLTSSGVSTATINFNYSGANYTTASSNRRANSTGWTITKMMRYKI